MQGRGVTPAALLRGRSGSAIRARVIATRLDHDDLEVRRRLLQVQRRGAPNRTRSDHHYVSHCLLPLPYLF
jgi:hypothetical protein